MSLDVHYVHHGDMTVDIGPHVFPIEKYVLLRELLLEELGVGEERMHLAEAVAEGDLERVHSAQYVEDLRLARTTPATLASELPVEHAVIQAFVAQAGGSVTALRLALEHGLGFHIGGGLHHAFPDHAEGFCYVHDVAVAIERLRAEDKLRRVLIVDTDVHQGNGTAVIYANDLETFTYSIHQEDNYPIKQRSDLDRGLVDGLADEVYLRILSADLDAIDSSFEPDLVCYVGGVDPFEHDQLGGLSLTEEGLERRDAVVLERYAARDVPIAVLLAGGYARSPEETARLHLGTARVSERLRSDASGGL
jgi:acetoin utilization deacetylase AcuC-like enzyme